MKEYVVFIFNFSLEYKQHTPFTDVIFIVTNMCQTVRKTILIEDIYLFCISSVSVVLLNDSSKYKCVICIFFYFIRGP